MIFFSNLMYQRKKLFEQTLFLKNEMSILSLNGPLGRILGQFLQTNQLTVW